MQNGVPQLWGYFNTIAYNSVQYSYNSYSYSYSYNRPLPVVLCWETSRLLCT